MKFGWNQVRFENEINLKGLAVEPQYTGTLCISENLDLHKKSTNTSTQKFQVFEALELENKVT